MAGAGDGGELGAQGQLVGVHVGGGTGTRQHAHATTSSHSATSWAISHQGARWHLPRHPGTGGHRDPSPDRRRGGPARGPVGTPVTRTPCPRVGTGRSRRAEGGP
ncbi:hypothetical protein GCM10023225_07900 [Kineococcus glutinatus]|uniref:Uncharacterized protein n=1 Tax=Kineococcus glutinatus TaxID=1070872 RepID=A0ABP9HD70_9ACTN